MDKMDLAMYEAFEKLLHEDGHLVKTDIFAFRLGWRECQAAQQSMHLTGGNLRDLPAVFTLEDGTAIEQLPTPPTRK